MVSVTELLPIGVGSESNFLESGSDVSYGDRIKITAEDDDGIDYVEYYWNDDDSSKKYYDELNGATGIVAKAGELVGNASTLVSTIGKLQSQLDVSTWKELGQEQLVTVTVPALKDRFDKFKSNITNSLQVACNEAINTLLPIFNGATKLVLQPINTLSPIIVLCLYFPS